MSNMEYMNLNIQHQPSEDSSFELIYNGELLNNNEKIYIHYGFNNWQNVNEVQLKQTKDGFVAKIFIPKGSKELNFVFRANDNWDNNSHLNYNLKIERKYIPTEIKASNVEYFKTDYILPMDLNNSLKSAFKMDVELQNNVLNNIQRSMASLFGEIEEKQNELKVSQNPLIQKLENIDLENISVSRITEINKEANLPRKHVYTSTIKTIELKKLALHKQLQLTMKREAALVPQSTLISAIYESSLSDSVFSIAKYIVNFVKSIFSLSSLKERILATELNKGE